VRIPVRLERIGLPPAAVEREHQLSAQSLAQRVLADERVELARDLGMPAAGEVGVDPRAEAAEAQILEPRDLGLGEALVGDVGERRPAPELERVLQRGGRLPRLTARELLAPQPQAPLEAVGVERVRRESQAVAAALGHDQVLAQRGPDARRHDVDGVARVLRAGSVPQLIDDTVEVDRGAVAHEKQREEREGAAARHADDLGFQLDLDGAEDPEPDVHFAAEPIPVSNA
jgi:hypothetical protein